MKLPGPLQLAKIMKNAIANQARYAEQCDRRIEGQDSRDLVKVSYYLKTTRIEEVTIISDSVTPKVLAEAFKEATNNALLKADEAWEQMDKDVQGR